MTRFFPSALLLIPVACAQSFPKLAIEHYQLPNGMEVILCRNPKIPLVNLNLRFRVGSKDERPGRAGFAHLFEHLLFDMADGANGDFITLAEQSGASIVGATTHADYTEFHETVPSARLERMLWLESNRLKKLPLSLTQARFDQERDVVRNEFREKIENQPYTRINLPLYQYSFPEGHPYAHHPIGSHEDLLAATLDDVRAFYRDYYNPDNLSLVLAGDFDPPQAKAWIAKYLGAGPRIERRTKSRRNARVWPSRFMPITNRVHRPLEPKFRDPVSTPPCSCSPTSSAIPSFPKTLSNRKSTISSRILKRPKAASTTYGRR
jgi:zinc protease